MTPIQTRMKKIGTNVKLARQLRKMKQTELADKVGWEQGDIAKLEGGQGNITIFTLLKFADALECDLQVSLSPINK